MSLAAIKLNQPTHQVTVPYASSGDSGSSSKGMASSSSSFSLGMFCGALNCFTELASRNKEIIKPAHLFLPINKECRIM
jgi:hypothetical protein